MAEIFIIFFYRQLKNKCMKDPEQHGNYFLVLRNPVHSYHGNHWFHFGEHFIARTNELTHLSSLPNNSTLYILSNNQKLLNYVTPFTFFMLLLACWYPNIGRIALLKVNQPQFQSSSIDSYEINKELKLLAIPTKFEYKQGEYIYDRFVKVQDEPALAHEQFFEGKIIGGIGDYPVSSLNWFQSAEDIRHLQLNIERLCIGSDVFDSGKQKDPDLKKNRIVLYQRDETRKIINYDYLLETLEKYFQNDIGWEVLPVYHYEERNPCFLYEIMKETKVFISLHGFQLTCK
jgi:hypothetical protein